MQALVATAPNVGLGFAKPEDVRRAKLETPLRVYLVRLDALQAMNDRTPLSSLLLDARRTLYPVTVDGRVVSGLFAQENNGTWTVQQFGEAALARTSDAHRRSVNDILVWIPAAKLYFVGSGTGNALTLTPLVNDPRFGFAVDQNMPARAVLERVAHAMADYNGLPQ
ncbi:MAG: hypothetical protein JOZ13_10125 [Alphaproteobacteria bacterium]|nr:hypothetical protein [Alphaproteobacteria bacterium]